MVTTKLHPDLSDPSPRPAVSTARHCAKLAALIVSYGNPRDIERCLNALARSSWTDFEIFVCENAGKDAFARLRMLLTGQDGPLEQTDDSSDTLDTPGGRLAAVLRCRFRDRAITVRLAAATENLGYAGGVNAWLERLIGCPGWEAVLVLNPDTEVAETCLSELMTKAAEGFGMVGGSLVFDDAPDRIINYGLHWSPRTGRRIAVGGDSPVGSAPSDELLANIDTISGACMLVTREFIDDVGLMVEDYFLYMEDLDWGRRRGQHKIGFAPGALTRHVGGTSIGSAREPKAQSPLSVYLTSRNSVLFSRRWAGCRWPLHFGVGLLYVIRYVLNGCPETAKVALVGLIDGFRGKTGRPDMSAYRPIPRG
jgi:N-acetylglucosaminyl-diphospho-decaprenol L-rhamnosyltransferase